MFEANLDSILAPLCPQTYAMVADDDFQTPCIVYTVINTIPQNDMAGWTGLAEIAFQVDVYDLDFLSALRLAEAVRTSLMTKMPAVIWTGRSNFVDKTTPTHLYRSSMEFNITTAP